jgi:hypothetical protein
MISMALSWYTLRLGLRKIFDLIADYPDAPSWENIVIQAGDVTPNSVNEIATLT